MTLFLYGCSLFTHSFPLQRHLSVLASSAAITKHQRPGTYTTELCFWRRRLRSRNQHSWALGGPTSRSAAAYLPMSREERRSYPVSFIKGTNPIMGAPPLWPHSSPVTFQTILLLTFQASSCDTFFNLQYYWFGYILFANLLIWTNLVLYKLQVTSCICDLTLQYFIVQKINLLLIFMLIRCIFIFI